MRELRTKCCVFILASCFMCNRDRILFFFFVRCPLAGAKWSLRRSSRGTLTSKFAKKIVTRTKSINSATSKAMELWKAVIAMVMVARWIFLCGHGSFSTLFASYWQWGICHHVICYHHYSRIDLYGNHLIIASIAIWTEKKEKKKRREGKSLCWWAEMRDLST